MQSLGQSVAAGKRCMSNGKILWPPIYTALGARKGEYIVNAYLSLDDVCASMQKRRVVNPHDFACLELSLKVKLRGLCQCSKGPACKHMHISKKSDISGIHDNLQGPCYTNLQNHICNYAIKVPKEIHNLWPYIDQIWGIENHTRWPPPVGGSAWPPGSFQQQSG